MSGTLLDGIHALPEDVRDRVKIYALALATLPMKIELRHHFERKEAEAVWWKIGEDWLTYCRELEEDFDEMTTLLGYGVVVDEQRGGLAYVRAMAAAWRGHCHPMESWYRDTPIRHAATLADKEPTLIPPLISATLV